MSATTPKKPPGAGGTASGNTSTARKAPASSSTSTSNGVRPATPTRMASQNSNTAPATGTANVSVNRARSVRNGAGTPVSARAAARKPATPDSSLEDDAKAELQAELADLQARLAESEASLTSSQKQAEVLQIKLDEALNEQSMLEDNVHESTERIEELENERREKERGRREMEQIYEAERAANIREKEESIRREDEMQSSIIRMKEALQARELRAGLEDAPYIHERGSRMSLSRSSSHRLSNSHSPVPPEFGSGSDSGTPRQFAPSSLQRSDSRSSSRLVMQKDKIIESLRLELAEAQIKLVELENKGGGHVQLLEKDMYDIKIQNARLMEENESFQLLLQEKTLNGDLLRTRSRDRSSRPPSSRNIGIGGASLADELQDEDANSAIEPDSAAADSAVSGPESKERRLQHEVNVMKDQNKALTLYINNIISRLLQHEQFEAILDKTPDLMAGPTAISRKYQSTETDVEKELPPPPPPKDERPLPAAAAVQALQTEEGQQGQGMGFLQRAGSVLKRARPQSVIQPIPPPDQQQPRLEEHTVHEDPTTAPKIPISRSRSTRQAPTQSSHRRTNSDWPAATVVTNMYRGPSPVPSGPLSPGLGSPTSSARNNPFFRSASGNTVPTISEADLDKENSFPGPVTTIQRGSKLDAPANPIQYSRSNSAVSNTSNRDSIASIPQPSLDAPAEISSNPSSPPRSTTSSDDRNASAARGGNIMMGSKPRPLRLVQGAAVEDERARKQANRGSWFGWMGNNVNNLREAGQRVVQGTGSTPPTGGMSGFVPGQQGRAGSTDGRLNEQ